MPTFDPYRVLQVHPEADTEIIQVAYRKLAQRHHPDVATDPEAARRMAEVLSFGRYAGWSLGEIARRDLEYVEWLDRMPIGRPYRAEIDALLRARGRRGGSARPEEPHGLYRRR